MWWIKEAARTKRIDNLIVSVNTKDVKWFRKFQFVLPLGFILFNIIIYFLAVSPLETLTQNCGSGFISFCFGWFSSIFMDLYLPVAEVITALIRYLGISDCNGWTCGFLLTFLLYIILLALLGKLIDSMRAKKLK